MATFITTGVTNKPKNTAYTVGKVFKTIPAKVTITAAANANGDTYVLAGPLNYDDRIHRILGKHGAFTSATNNDLGFFTKDNDGNLVALDADILWDGANMATAVTATDDLLTKYNASLNTEQTIGELLGKNNDQIPANGVFLVLTENTASSATSETFYADVIVECATAN